MAKKSCIEELAIASWAIGECNEVGGCEALVESNFTLFATIITTLFYFF
jgi:hypothetical protein